MWVWLKLKLIPEGDFCVVSVTAFFVNNISLRAVLRDTWKGKYSDFPPQTPQVRPKSAIYTPKRDNEHPGHFDMWVPPPPPPPRGCAFGKATAYNILHS